MAGVLSEKEILDRMRRMCSRREYCSSDILRKIRSIVPDGRIDAEGILSSLADDGYFDDARYAGAFARDKACLSGWGRAKIRHALLAKGIGADIADAAVLCVDEEKASDKFERIIRNKMDSLGNDPMMRVKTIRFALGRGYGYDETIMAIDRIKGVK